MRHVISIPNPSGKGVTGPVGVSSVGVLEGALSIWNRCVDAGKP